ncbi:MAG: HAD-superfamily hydrolase, subfamily variant 3 [Nocardioidaceae bacterium]|nr:HAD-superfamily hydrolase, subfamily variant 3 [Nocardioidaceae bacterium]
MGLTPAAVVFDLGNVLVRWDPHPAIAAGVGNDEAERFLAAADFDFLAWNHLQDGGRTWDEAEAEVEATHPHWARHAASYRAEFAHSLLGAVDDSVAVLRELHTAGVRLVALTNWSSELFPHARERFAFLTLFEDIVVSGDEGVAKPAPEIFARLQQRLGLALDRCVFVDDKAENVAAAARAGMDAIVFTDGAHLRDDLRARGLPV